MFQAKSSFRFKPFQKKVITVITNPPKSIPILDICCETNKYSITPNLRSTHFGMTAFSFLSETHQVKMSSTHPSHEKERNSPFSFIHIQHHACSWLNIKFHAIKLNQSQFGSFI